MHRKVPLFEDGAGAAAKNAINIPLAVPAVKRFTCRGIGMRIERGTVKQGSQPEKTCLRCGRTIEWRKKWERDWDNVLYCSQACRSAKLTSTDAALEAAILTLLDARGAGKTICPSEAARKIASDDRAAWEPLMEPARAAARRLVAAGRILITQGGQVVDPSRARGPIRLRKT